jgi:hypothetical protein
MLASNRFMLVTIDRDGEMDKVDHGELRKWCANCEFDSR